ncbi:MAG: DEAD/DEAH box helicase [Anaerolineae bacterium]
MDTRDFLDHVKRHPAYRGQIQHVEHIPARPARYGKLDRPMHPFLEEALRRVGIGRLYTHQAQAINAVRAGKHVAVTTGTSSGKTLCYNLPVLETTLEDWRSRAFYLFPTKALAQDQLRALGELAGGRIRFGAYDGDTPQAARSRLRREAAIILTNPDMLHLGILPNHRLWGGFLRNLKYVVIDEAHIYRGVFGAHVACVLRRLRRLCEFYGSNPQFIFCSATIANPQEHIANLAGLEPVVIDDDGSPQGARDFALWNPPFVDRARTVRRSANFEAAFLFAEMARSELRNITFTRARKVAELILLYAREALEKESAALAKRICSYRAGYLPEERREIEAKLFNGELLGVTATTALELGVDVGHLDATVLVGYPGTIASTWQQAGRSGRSGRRALSMLIGLDNPLDQYFMRHPKELFGRSHEHALVDPDNFYVLLQHLPCAAHELPLTERDEALFGPGFAPALDELARQGIVSLRQGRWYQVGFSYPAQDVNIRSISGGHFALLDESHSNRVIEEIEATTAFSRVHPGAIYLHQGESYLVTWLDMINQAAYLRPVEVDYYTQPREINDVRILRSFGHKEVFSTRAYLGHVRVTQQVIGYKRVQQFTETVLSVEYLDLPAQSFDTVALWFDVPAWMAREAAERRLDFAGGLHAVEHASIALLPLFAMCDRMDLGGLSTPRHPDTDRPQIFIYDAYPGGVGIAEKGFELIAQLWQATLETIRDCPCQTGCPSCIQSPKCGNNNEPLDKEAALLILQFLLSKEHTPEHESRPDEKRSVTEGSQPHGSQAKSAQVGGVKV